MGCVIGLCDQTENGFSSSWGWILICLLSLMPILGPIRGTGKLIGSVLVMSPLLRQEDGLLEPRNQSGGERDTPKRGLLFLQILW